MQRTNKKIVQDFDDIFEFEKMQDSKQMTMEFNRMRPFSGHLFKLYEGQQLEDMIESIKQYGIIIPIILWHKDKDTYIILSGHNRVNAGKEAGLTQGPVVIKENLTQEEAVLIVTETNLRQRSFNDLSYSERALCLSQHYEAIKCQGKRNDLINEIDTLINPHGDKDCDTSAQVEQKFTNREKIANENGISHAKIARYIRLSTLVSTLLSLIDNGKIAFLAGYTLSFVEDIKLQTLIADIVECDGYKVDIKKAELLREYYEKKKLNETTIRQILSGEKTRKLPGKAKAIKVKPAIVKKYFKNEESQEEIAGIIEKALDMYFSKAASTQ